MSSSVVTPSGHEEFMRVNDRCRFYAHFEDLALVLVVFCDMVWILTDFDVSAAILVDVR